MLNDLKGVHNIEVEEIVPPTEKADTTSSSVIKLNSEQMKKLKATNSFINTLTNSIDGGKGFEQSARFAVYSGAVKSAELAAKAGHNSILGYADNTVTATTAKTELGIIFVVQTHNAFDSDSYNAEGLDYGSDLKLTGVAHGVDFDLDYMGVGLFVKYEDNGINVVTYLSHTQSSSDIRANIADTQVKSDIDTKVLSFGVNGSYKFDLDSTYVKSYVGVRLSKYEVNDYILSAKVV